MPKVCKTHNPRRMHAVKYKDNKKRYAGDCIFP